MRPSFSILNFSLAFCINRCNQVKNTTVIARSEATWQSPDRMLDNPKCSKHGIFWLILLFYVQLLLVDCTGRLPRRQKPPRNDTVVGSWSQPSNSTLNPNLKPGVFCNTPVWLWCYSFLRKFVCFAQKNRCLPANFTNFTF